MEKDTCQKHCSLLVQCWNFKLGVPAVGKAQPIFSYCFFDERLQRLLHNVNFWCSVYLRAAFIRNTVF